MSDLSLAKKLLKENNYTCVLVKEKEIYYSTKRGVKPLLDFLYTHKDFSDFSCADKTVGGGAAHLYALLKVKAVWADVISERGIDVLEKNNIILNYEKRVPFIINRQGDGQCPVEKSLTGIDSPEEALKTIEDTLVLLESKK